MNIEIYNKKIKKDCLDELEKGCQNMFSEIKTSVQEEKN